jgi:HAD superfamily hydrolase (TIGR01490 family)
MSTSDGLARAAFFDVDKTLLPGSSLYLLARGMYKRGMYTGRDLVGFAVGQVAFRVRGVESLKGIDAAREAALAFIEGKRQHELEPLAQDIVVEVIGPRIYPGMRKVIDAHHANGDRTYLVTAAPVDIAKRISAYLGMDGALGTRVECVDGVYTGKLLGPVLHGRAKLEAVRALAAETGIDLAASSAYSDSMNDRPLLEGVGHPVAVNPDRMLRRFAAENAWPVQDFRSGRWLLVWGPSVAGALAAGEATRRALARRRRRLFGDN